MGLQYFFTDHHLTARHLVVIDKQTKRLKLLMSQCLQIISMKEKEKIDKHKGLCVELLSLWRAHCEVIPLVIGRLGCITNMLQGYLQRLEISPFCTVELLQRTAVWY